VKALEPIIFANEADCTKLAAEVATDQLPVS